MSLVLVFLLLPVCAFAPGFFFVRRLRWTPLEKLCGSVGLSLILLYLATWAIFCARVPGGAAPYWAISAGCAAIGIACRRDIRRLGRVPAVRRALLGQVFLWGWAFLILAMIRVYSGAGWFGDDLEHFQRSLFFLHRFPLNTPISDQYLLPARPPMMNVMAAFFMAQTRDSYDIFQVVFTFLNALLLLPCCLILPALLNGAFHRRPARYASLALAALFALNPAIVQNATYGWTKLLAAFFVILGLALYLAGWRKTDRVRTTAGFAALAAGLLVHYSAGPYCVLAALHYVARLFWRRPRKWRELAGIAAVSGLLLATWFGWSLAAYGPRVTFQSNSSVTYAQRYAGNGLVKIAANIFDSVVPAIVRDPSLFRQFDQASPAGRLREKAFLFYQVNLVFGMGLVGGPLALFILFRAFRGRRAAPGTRPRERSFWLLAVPFLAIVGIAVVGERDLFGVAHLTLLSLTALGLASLAAAFPLPRAAAAALLAGLIADFSLGVYLQARIESRENTPDRTVFAAAYNIDSASPVPGDPIADSLSLVAQRNWYHKHQYELTARWLGELTAYHAKDAAGAGYAARGIAQLQTRLRDDSKYWGGWFARHDNRLRYLGDIVAEDFGIGADALSGVLLIGSAGVIFWLGRQFFRVGRPLRAAAGFPAGAPRGSAAAARKVRPTKATMAPTASRGSGRPDPKSPPRA